MGRWQQYEVLIEKAESQWETLGAFSDVGLATAVASQRSGRVRVIEVTYEDDKLVSQEIIADLGHYSSAIPAR